MIFSLNRYMKYPKMLWKIEYLKACVLDIKNFTCPFPELQTKTIGPLRSPE
jgi:hypothetical protein